MPCQSGLTHMLLIFSAVRESCAFEQRQAQPEGSDLHRKNDSGNPLQYVQTPPNALAMPNSYKVYSPDECVGAIVMGECHGAIIEHGGYHPTCHGEMLNGQCTGPMF